MFVYYFVHVDRPAEEVKMILLSLLDGLAGAADIAYQEGEELHMKAGLGKMVAKKVELQVGAPLGDDGKVVIPLRWEATGATGLFPRWRPTSSWRRSAHGSLRSRSGAPIGPRSDLLAKRSTRRYSTGLPRRPSSTL